MDFGDRPLYTFETKHNTFFDFKKIEIEKYKAIKRETNLAIILK